MTEDEARSWVRERWGVSRETRLAAFADLVRAEAPRQNLVSLTTLESLWARHITDSAQLLLLAGDRGGQWLDIGTGAGFPGIVIACLRDEPITLCEPRKRRAEFLNEAAESLGLTNVSVAPTKVERLTGKFATISARAVGPLTDLIAAAHPLSTRDTIWLLPKGRTASAEVATARETWHGSFHVEQSITQTDSMIVVATNLARRR